MYHQPLNPLASAVSEPAWRGPSALQEAGSANLEVAPPLSEFDAETSSVSQDSLASTRTVDEGYLSSSDGKMSSVEPTDSSPATSAEGTGEREQGRGAASGQPQINHHTHSAQKAEVPGDALLPGKHERITILFMGVDSRPGESLVSRTDTMMLISVNLRRQTVSILSIPRDLYVHIPGHRQARINSAFVYGGQGDNPAGGAALAMQTVEEALAVRINHYVVVNFQAAVRAIDALGGIDIFVPRTINDPSFPDMYYGYDPLYIPKGYHHFDGETALKYARTRHQDNDFYRAGRQQQLLFAVRKKVLSLGLTNLISRAPSIYRNVSQGVYTDLSLEEVLRMARLVSDIPAENIQTAVLDHEYLRGYRTPDGAHVYLLVPEKTTPLIRGLFYDE